VKLTIKASANLGLTVMGTFPGALLWPFMYPWPQRPAGLVEEGFKELAKRWKPILDYADKFGVDCAFELHPGEDLHDGVTFDRFLEATGNHPRVKILYDPSHFILQCLDYVGFIDEYGAHIKAFHVKDAEFRPSAKAGVYGSFSGWKSVRAASAASATARWISNRSSRASPPPATAPGPCSSGSAAIRTARRVLPRALRSSSRA